MPSALGNFLPISAANEIACVANAKGGERKRKEKRARRREETGEEGRKGVLATKTRIPLFIRSEYDRKMLIG